MAEFVLPIVSLLVNVFIHTYLPIHETHTHTHMRERWRVPNNMRQWWRRDVATHVWIIRRFLLGPNLFCRNDDLHLLWRTLRQRGKKSNRYYQKQDLAEQCENIYRIVERKRNRGKKKKKKWNSFFSNLTRKC